jgi:hypothetical protein
LQIFDVHWNFSYRLRGVAVQRHAPLAADGADRRQVVDGADLVVGEHHRHQKRVVANGLGHLLRIDEPGPRASRRLDVQQRDLETPPAEPGERIENRLVLGPDADDVIAPPPRAIGQPAEGQVVALGGAAGEDDLLGLGADRRRDRFPRRLDRRRRVPSENVAGAAGIAVNLAEQREHRLNHARIDARRGVIVHVDGHGEAGEWSVTRDPGRPTHFTTRGSRLTTQSL